MRAPLLLVVALLPVAAAFDPYTDHAYSLEDDWGFTTSTWDIDASFTHPCLRHGGAWTLGDGTFPLPSRDHGLNDGVLSLVDPDVYLFTSYTTLVPGTTSDCSGDRYYHQYSIWTGGTFRFEGQAGAAPFVVDFAAPMQARYAQDLGRPLAGDCHSAPTTGEATVVHEDTQTGTCSILVVPDLTGQAELDWSYNTYLHPQQVLVQDPLTLDQVVVIKAHQPGADGLLRITMRP